jgi:hypothetical protein
MRKALRLIAVLAAFGLTAWIGVVALAHGSSAPASSTTTSAVSTGGEDLEGNCDEAEHANDPECVGVNPAVDDAQGDDVNDDDQGDVNDDDQGENEVNDDQGENDDDQGDVNDDDQGDNSGPGSENSGPGSEDSGSGSGS